MRLFLLFIKIRILVLSLYFDAIKFMGSSIAQCRFEQSILEIASLPRFGQGGMIVPDDIGSYAYRKGFYVLAQSGENMVILNDNKFQPRVW